MPSRVHIDFHAAAILEKSKADDCKNLSAISKKEELEIGLDVPCDWPPCSSSADDTHYVAADPCSSGVEDKPSIDQLISKSPPDVQRCENVNDAGHTIPCTFTQKHLNGNACNQIEGALIDIPSKSWDHAKLFKLWNKIHDEAAVNKVGCWIKDRYFHKFGVHIKNMDKSVSALSDIELNALMMYCQSLDASLLEIPFYIVENPVLQECESTDDSPICFPCSPKDPEKRNPFQGVKLAGVTKRGMAQPARRH